MASSKEYLTFILEQLSDLEGISYRAMMGEYIIYYREKIVGGIYDDRLLVKPVKSAVSLMPNAIYELPYDGAKEMLLVNNVDNKDFLTCIGNARTVHSAMDCDLNKNSDPNLSLSRISFTRNSARFFV